MLAFLVLTAVTFSLFGFIIGIWADGFEKLQVVPLLIITPLTLPRRQLLFDQHAAAGLADRHAVQSGRLSDQRLPLELLRHRRRRASAISLAMTLVFLAVCLAIVWWMFRTGYRLKK